MRDNSFFEKIESMIKSNKKINTGKFKAKMCEVIIPKEIDIKGIRKGYFILYNCQWMSP